MKYKASNIIVACTHCTVLNFVKLHSHVHMSAFIVQLQAIHASSLELTGLDLRLYGAELTDEVDERVTHIVFDTK